VAIAGIGVVNVVRVAVVATPALLALPPQLSRQLLLGLSALPSLLRLLNVFLLQSSEG